MGDIYAIIITETTAIIERQQEIKNHMMLTECNYRKVIQTNLFTTTHQSKRMRKKGRGREQGESKRNKDDDSIMVVGLQQ
mmetsp:Transcript_6373/g.10182  ORF Transcript_6373/g.10182 Transcript_6373/m.10182 type:complete len:80 (-) Transcript_6373:730-969(-)